MKHYNLILALPQLIFSLLVPALASWDPYCFLKIHLANSQWGKLQAFKAKTRQQRTAPKTRARRKKLAILFFLLVWIYCGVFCLFLNVVFKNSHSWGKQRTVLVLGLNTAQAALELWVCITDLYLSACTYLQASPTCVQSRFSKP